MRNTRLVWACACLLLLNQACGDDSPGDDDASTRSDAGDAGDGDKPDASDKPDKDAGPKAMQKDSSVPPPDDNGPDHKPDASDDTDHDPGDDDNDTDEDPDTDEDTGDVDAGNDEDPDTDEDTGDIDAGNDIDAGQEDTDAGTETDGGPELIDTDHDGVPDGEDAFPEDPTESIDSDKDGVGDNTDAFPRDATETVDSDSDGVGDNADGDDDNATLCADTDGDGCDDCMTGSFDPASDGDDANMDGLCDACDAAVCSGYGVCESFKDSVICDCSGRHGGADCSECATGYDNVTGEDCSECASGYQDKNDDGTCAPRCTLETCSATQACDDSSGTAVCTCMAGFDGPDCEHAQLAGTRADGDVSISGARDLLLQNSGDRDCGDGGDAVVYTVNDLGSRQAFLDNSPSADCLAAGDEVLLIKLVGGGTLDNQIGNYEFLRIEAIESDIVSFTTRVMRSYAPFDVAPGDWVVLQRVPNYDHVTLDQGSVLSAARLNVATRSGTGALVFRAEQVSVDGTISAIGTGFVGASRTTGANASGGSGSGPAGLGLGGGPGGGGDGDCDDATNGVGGGGGGFGTAGSAGSKGVCGQSGGAEYGDALMSRVFVGAGGGAGGTDDTLLNNPPGGRGGNGGGLVLIAATTFAIGESGRVDASGSRGEGDDEDAAYPCEDTDECWDFSGPGGGGAGGTIWIAAANLALGSDQVVAHGGPGGHGYSSETDGAGDGGQGGEGRILIHHLGAVDGDTPPDAQASAFNCQSVFRADPLAGNGSYLIDADGPGGAPAALAQCCRGDVDCDGVLDDGDACPSSLSGAEVDAHGCSELVPVNLHSVYNQPHTQSWVGCCGFGDWFHQPDQHIGGIDFSVAPIGETFHGVAVGGSAPPQVSIPLEGRIGSAHVLVSAGWATCDTTFPVTFHYTDGTTAGVALSGPEHCNDCGGVALAIEDNCVGNIFTREFANPRPWKAVESLTIDGSPDSAQLYLVAMTVSGELDAGCADGSREGFVDKDAIAACSGGFGEAGIVSLSSGGCSYTAGDDNANPNGVDCNVSDLCMPGWHVCNDQFDVLAHSPGGCEGATPSADPPLFFATRQTGSGNTLCDNQGANDVFGCGNTGTGGDPSSCDPLFMSTGDLCGNLTELPWECGSDSQHEAENIVKPGADGGGVLCCRN